MTLMKNMWIDIYVEHFRSDRLELIILKSPCIRLIDLVERLKEKKVLGFCTFDSKEKKVCLKGVV